MVPDAQYTRVKPLHSTTPSTVAALPSTHFWDSLLNLSNPSLWKQSHCDGDGTWIHHDISQYSLLMVNNGSRLSYCPHLSSCLLWCFHDQIPSLFGLSASGSWAEFGSGGLALTLPTCLHIQKREVNCNIINTGMV